MVVDDLYFTCAADAPFEEDAPVVVDTDAARDLQMLIGSDQVQRDFVLQSGKMVVRGDKG